MGWYRLTWPKAILAFLIDLLGYAIFGPFNLIRGFISGLHPFTPTKILLLRLDHMGDVLMATPAMIALRRSFPKARIYVAVKKNNCPLISLPGVVDEIVPLTPWWTVSPGEERDSWPSLWRKIRGLRRESFDLGIDFKGDMRNILLLFLAGSRRRLSYGIRGGGFLLTKTVKYLSGPRHEVDRNLDFIRALVGEIDRMPPRYQIGPEEEREVKIKFEKIFTPGEKLIGIHPGANSSSKIWPAAYFAKLIDKIKEEGLGRVIIFAGPKEKEILRALKLSLKSAPLLLDNLSLKDLAAFFKELDLFIGNDSGPFHLAEAVGTTVVTIFGSTFSDIVGPVSPESEVVKSRRFCAPCRRPGERERCVRNDCLRDISVEEVYEVIQKRLRL